MAHCVLYFFHHRIFYGVCEKLSLGHCIALLIVFTMGKVLICYRSYVKTLLSWIRCGVYANELIIRSSNWKHDFYVQANFEETLFKIQRTML